jgi:hypothetical protein
MVVTTQIGVERRSHLSASSSNHDGLMAVRRTPWSSAEVRTPICLAARARPRVHRLVTPRIPGQGRIGRSIRIRPRHAHVHHHLRRTMSCMCLPGPLLLLIWKIWKRTTCPPSWLYIKEVQCAYMYSDRNSVSPAGRFRQRSFSSLYCVN